MVANTLHYTLYSTTDYGGGRWAFSEHRQAPESITDRLRIAWKTPGKRQRQADYNGVAISSDVGAGPKRSHDCERCAHECVRHFSNQIAARQYI
jgi:hypothetical protein